jgi:hypothetical protein
MIRDLDDTIQELLEQKRRPDSKLAHATDRVGSAASTNDHATTPSRVGQPLLRLQRLYGNRYVQRVVAQAKEEVGETEVSSDVEEAVQRKRGGGQPLESGVRNQIDGEAQRKAAIVAVEELGQKTGRGVWIQRWTEESEEQAGQTLIGELRILCADIDDYGSNLLDEITAWVYEKWESLDPMLFTDLVTREDIAMAIWRRVDKIHEKSFVRLGTEYAYHIEVGFGPAFLRTGEYSLEVALVSTKPPISAEQLAEETTAEREVPAKGEESARTETEEAEKAGAPTGSTKQLIEDLDHSLNHVDQTLEKIGWAAQVMGDQRLLYQIQAVRQQIAKVGGPLTKLLTAEETAEKALEFCAAVTRVAGHEPGGKDAVLALMDLGEEAGELLIDIAGYMPPGLKQFLEALGTAAKMIPGFFRGMQSRGESRRPEEILRRQRLLERLFQNYPDLPEIISALQARR